MNFKPNNFYNGMKTIFNGVKSKVVVPKKVFMVYFKEGEGLCAIAAHGAYDHEDAILFTKEAITGDINKKQAFLTVIEGGK